MKQTKINDDDVLCILHPIHPYRSIDPLDSLSTLDLPTAVRRSTGTYVDIDHKSQKAKDDRKLKAKKKKIKVVKTNFKLLKTKFKMLKTNLKFF